MMHIEQQFNKILKNKIIKETFLFENKEAWLNFKKFNRIFAFIVAIIPIIATLFNFILPDLIVNVFCAFCVYIPYFLEKQFGIIILEEARFGIIFHSMLHTIFGKTLHFYDKYPLYDSILHLLGGMLIVFATLPVITSIEINCSNHTKKVIRRKANFSTFNFVNTLGVGWETIEFVADLLFRDIPGYRIAQEDSLFDTMTDLIENNIGGFVAILIFWKIVNYFEKNGRDMHNLFKNILQPIEKTAQTK